MKNITVIGAGTMGNGIAHTFAQKNFNVNLVDISADALHHIYRCLKGRRLFQPYGKLKGVKRVIEKKDNTLNADWLRPASHIWKFDQQELDYINEYDEVMINTQSIKNQISSEERRVDKNEK